MVPVTVSAEVTSARATVVTVTSAAESAVLPVFSPSPPAADFREHARRQPIAATSAAKVTTIRPRLSVRFIVFYF